ncbi:MAG TPA: hypothetical protein DEH25_07455 [Chloroflexi bacterium]|nr:hypothetical protein [Chloroflexota bacterium]HBY08233.1 hypothetical protein [Chloroflexota bacterium]
MKISYRRTGGFAGMLISHSFDTDTLPKTDAEELVKLVSAADFFALPSKITATGADQFQYTLTVETAEQQHTLEVGETSAPENLRPLLEKLRLLARGKPDL